MSCQGLCEVLFELLKQNIRCTHSNIFDILASSNTDGLNESKKVNYSDYTIRIEVIFSGSNPGWFYEYSESTEKYE